MTALSKALTIGDLKNLARRRVPKLFFDYADSGALTEQTYRANSEDYDSILLRQRVARKLSDRSLATKIVGLDFAMPVGLSPVGSLGMQHADGEIHAARAAEKFGVPFTLSTMSVCSIEDVRAATTRPFWFQLYVMKDRDFALSLLERARAANVSALVLTLDLQLLAQRHKDLRNELRTPPRLTPKHLMMMALRPRWSLGMAQTQNRTFRNVVGHVKGVRDLGTFTEWTNSQFDPDLDWSAVSWFKEHWGGKLILKGITDPEDARLAVDHGADALIVSNHGGRQLDGAPSSIRSLPGILEAVGDRIEIHVDGGVRSGVDLFRGLALGAKSVNIGRPYVYGLGAGGEAGVTRALEILKTELDMTMALCGERDINAVGPHNLIDPPEALVQLAARKAARAQPSARPVRKPSPGKAAKPKPAAGSTRSPRTRRTTKS